MSCMRFPVQIPPLLAYDKAACCLQFANLTSRELLDFLDTLFHTRTSNPVSNLFHIRRPIWPVYTVVIRNHNQDHLGTQPK